MFAKQLSPALTDIYWEAFKYLAIEQFQEAAKSWIRHGKHFPKPADLSERFEQLTQAKPRPAPELPPPGPKWHRMVDSMFLKYLSQHRTLERFRGDINLAQRRAECLRLGVLFQAEEESGDASLATEEHLREQFNSAMRSVQDLTTDETWLPIELERQRQQDAQKERHETHH